MILKYHHFDLGFCRVCFTAQGLKTKQTYYYCLQEEVDNKVLMYRCSADWEPDYPVSFNGNIIFKIPPTIRFYVKDYLFTYLSTRSITTETKTFICMQCEDTNKTLF